MEVSIVRQMTLTEFAVFLDKLGYINIIYNDSAYDRLVYMLNPNRLFFQNDEGGVGIGGIRYIEYDDQPMRGATHCVAVCSSHGNCEYERRSFAIIFAKNPV